MHISLALQQAESAFAACSPTPRLDAEVLLGHVLGRDRSWLRAFGEILLDPLAFARYNVMVERRSAGEPVAYVMGFRDFWTLRLQVSPATLIPRPDTETLVEACLARLPRAASLLDLGTGSGAIALAIKSERADVSVTALDASTDALVVAQANASALALDVTFLQSDWFDALEPQHFDMIVSNPPYIEADDPHLASGDVRFEPRSALVSGEHGLDDIMRIVADAPFFLSKDGVLMFEHGYNQAVHVQRLLAGRGFAQITSLTDMAGHERVTFGTWCHE